MALILKDSTYVNWETLEFSKVHIKVEEGLNGKLTFFNDFDKILLSEADEVIDCKGKIVTKSFAVGHHHAYSALARGMPPPQKQPKNFQEILRYIWWNLDKALDKESIEASALATAIACAHAGSTFVIDHHASPNFIEGSLEIIAKAFGKVGISHLLCYEISDRDGLDKAEFGLRETENYLKKHHGLVGLHASFTVGKNTLTRAVNLMQTYNSGIHIHVAEDLSDQEHCLNTYGSRVLERLHDAGALESSKTILAHCLHINNRERELIKTSPAYVVQNTESNLNNRVGYFNSDQLGERILLGTDGMHSDMIRSAQASYFVGNSMETIDFQGAYRRFRTVHHYLETNNFNGDGENNLVVLDYDPPSQINQANFLSHFLFGFSSNDVHHVISGGRLILRDKNITGLDEKEVLAFCRQQASRLWEKMTN